MSKNRFSWPKLGVTAYSIHMLNILFPATTVVQRELNLVEWALLLTNVIGAVSLIVNGGYIRRDSHWFAIAMTTIHSAFQLTAPSPRQCSRGSEYS